MARLGRLLGRAGLALARGMGVTVLLCLWFLGVVALAVAGLALAGWLFFGPLVSWFPE